MNWLRFLLLVAYHWFGTQESYYQTVIYLLLAANNMTVTAEDMTNRGRADLAVVLPKAVYIFELKMDQPVVVALEQITRKNYIEKYVNLGLKMYLVGMELSKEDRVVKDLLCQPYEHENS